MLFHAETITGYNHGSDAATMSEKALRMPAEGNGWQLSALPDAAPYGVQGTPA